MANTQTNGVAQHLLRLTQQDPIGLTDGQLLDSFIHRRDESALAAIVRRHAPMVWGVCRRLLRSHQDVEDAFQATFLVLVRKAANIREKESLADWLYGVGRQTAVRLRATLAKQYRREQQVMNIPEPAVPERDIGSDLTAILDQELSALPRKYRVLIILCDLEGRTRKEAAQQLGCPEGTVNGRLARARTMLAKRLVRRTPEISGGVLAAALSQNTSIGSVPPTVIASAIEMATHFAAGRTATGIISSQVIDLTNGVLKTMLLNKLKVLSLALLVFASTVSLCAWLCQSSAAEPPSSPPDKTDLANGASSAHQKTHSATTDDDESTRVLDAKQLLANAQVTPAKPKTEEIEKKQLDVRQNIKSGHFAVKSRFFTQLRGNPPTTSESTLEVWFDGTNFRLDQDDGRKRVVKCLNEKIALRWEMVANSKAIPRNTTVNDRATGEKLTSTKIPDPRKLGLLPLEFVQLIHFPIDHWIARTNRTAPIMTEEMLDNRKVWKVEFITFKEGSSLPGGLTVRYWADPGKDWGIVRVEWESTDLKETVQTELQYLPCSGGWLPTSACWFPKKSHTQRIESGKLTREETLEVVTADLNPKIDHKQFEIEGLGLPKGTRLMFQSGGGEQEWDGEKMVPVQRGRVRPPLPNNKN